MWKARQWSRRLSRLKKCTGTHKLFTYATLVSRRMNLTTYKIGGAWIDYQKKRSGYLTNMTVMVTGHFTVILQLNFFPVILCRTGITDTTATPFSFTLLIFLIFFLIFLIFSHFRPRYLLVTFLNVLIIFSQ
jgi:hypothetical protein